MPHGVIEGFSETVQWKIPDFFSLDKIKSNKYIESPQFSSVGCTWYLRVYPKGDKVDGWLSAFLCLVDRPQKAVTYSIGLKRADGKIEEALSGNTNFDNSGTGRGLIKFWDLSDLQKRKSKLIPSGALTITCRMEREAPSSEKIAQNPQEVDYPPTPFVELEELSSDFENLLNIEETCDFTVNVQGKEFRVHRSVLAARSSVFRAMLVHDTAEAKSGVLTIPDCNPESFQDFLNFIYTGKIQNVSFETAYHLYFTADKYDVQRLKLLCCNYLRKNLDTENICKVLILSDQFCDQQLESSAQDFFNKNSMLIFLTSEWEGMLKDNYSLVNKVLKEMASASLKKSCNKVLKEFASVSLKKS